MGRTVQHYQQKTTYPLFLVNLILAAPTTNLTPTGRMSGLRWTRSSTRITRRTFSTTTTSRCSSSPTRSTLRSTPQRASPLLMRTTLARTDEYMVGDPLPRVPPRPRPLCRGGAPDHLGHGVLRANLG